MLFCTLMKCRLSIWRCWLSRFKISVLEIKHLQFYWRYFLQQRRYNIKSYHRRNTLVFDYFSPSSSILFETSSYNYPSVPHFPSMIPIPPSLLLPSISSSATSSCFYLTVLLFRTSHLPETSSSYSLRLLLTAVSPRLLWYIFLP